jgi:hypothetical protein
VNAEAVTSRADLARDCVTVPQDGEFLPVERREHLTMPDVACHSSTDGQRGHAGRIRVVPVVVHFSYSRPNRVRHQQVPDLWVQSAPRVAQDTLHASGRD